MTPLISDRVLQDVDLPAAPSAWLGHVPFAAWLVEQARPDVLVELGTHHGHSYFAFCQAVVANALATRCYAVDTWQGDPHAGEYGAEIFAAVERRNADAFQAFSRLLRMTFDAAASHFAAGSVDLLHIDGLHTYDAVRHDFETWLPSLSDRAVVLFHDTNVRERDFGVWRFWQEVSARYPAFEFLHSHGLGVLLVGPRQPEALRQLAAGDETATAATRRLFARLGRSLELASSLQIHLGMLRDTHQRLADALARGEQLKLALEASEQARGGLETVIGRLHAEAAALQGVVADREHALDALRRSTSWRLTAPYRWLARRVRAE